MQLDSRESTPTLPANVIDELGRLFAQVPPSMLREAVIKLYLCYSTSEDADLPQDIEKIDKPAQALINCLTKISSVQ